MIWAIQKCVVCRDLSKTVRSLVLMAFLLFGPSFVFAKRAARHLAVGTGVVLNVAFDGVLGFGRIRILAGGEGALRPTDAGIGLQVLVGVRAVGEMLFLAHHCVPL